MEAFLLALSKYSVLFICGFYGYLKLAKIKLKLINLLDVLVAVAFACALYFATNKVRLLLPVCFLLITFLYTLVRYRRSLLTTVTLSVISCGIAIFTMVIAFIISLPFEFIVFKFVLHETVRNAIIAVLLCSLQLITTFLIFRIKRLRSGISLQSNNGTIELLLLISILSIFFYSTFYIKNVTQSPVELIMMTLVFCGLGIIILWRKHVTNSYHDQIQKRNEIMYESRIEEYEKEKHALLEQNAELSKIIHRDNKLIPAMVTAVKKLIADAPNKKDLKELLSQLEELSAEHSEIINNYQQKADTLPKTENIALNAVIHFIYNKALQADAEIEFIVDEQAVNPLLQCVKDHTDLNTILCDLGENAIIATKSVERRKICVIFAMDGTSPCVTFFDSGKPFDEKVIANMGRRRISTHISEGGSGIGLMTLFEILNKYNASYCLDETPDNADYTKSVIITFDALHNINVISERNSVKKICQLRSDINFLNK